MIRKLSLAAAVAAALCPLNAFALGLGEIEVKSALNQILNADIKLHSVAEGGLDGVKVKLASPAAFSKAGIERPFSLTGLRFNPLKDAGGKPIIRISSKKPIREPFLNFLIEVDWSEGRLVREYTLLLDPPTTLKRRPPRIQPARIKEPPAPVKRRAPAPRHIPAPVKRQAVPPAAIAAREVRVRRHDSLWGIAKRNQVSGTSIQEMMIAIYRANPDAFNGNINNLNAGAILRMPTRRQIESISYAEARNEYLAHISAWDSTTHGETLFEPTPISRVPETKIETGIPPESVSSKAAPVETKGERVEILAAKPDETGAAGDQASKPDKARIDRLLKDLLLAKEATESSDMENKELQSRVSSLEGQVSDLERLISLKNDQFAKLQKMANEATEKERLAQEKAATLAGEQAEKEKQIETLQIKQKAEMERLAKEQAEKEKQIKALQAEQTAEKERLVKEQAEKEKQIKALQAEQTAEKERLVKEQAEKEQQIKALQAKQAAEKERLAKEKSEKDRQSRA